MQSQLLSLTTITVLAACVAPEPFMTEVEQHQGCQDWVCGSNSPMIANQGIWDLNVDGRLTANGFRLARFDKDGKSYRMSVVGAEIIGTPIYGGYVIRNNGTVGATMRVVHEPTGIHYNIRIAQVKGTNYWAHRDSAVRSTWTYELEWQSPDVPEYKDWQNICSKPDPDDDSMEPFHAVVFEGDRIDPARKVVRAPEPGWFNIGCAGHALAKLHLTGHTEGAKVGDGFVTSTAERTTMLKMLSGDYCGNGNAYTVAGVDLAWKDHRGWMRFPTFLTPVEARWTPTGAACLNTPRLVANPTEDGDLQFPDGVKQAIARECSIPRCESTHEVFHLISGNP